MHSMELWCKACWYNEGLKVLNKHMHMWYSIIIKVTKSGALSLPHSQKILRTKKIMDFVVVEEPMKTSFLKICSIAIYITIFAIWYMYEGSL